MKISFTDSQSYAAAGIGLLGVLLISSMLLINLALDNIRLDLTEQKLYTVSDGTLKVLEKIQQPINLYLFFSNQASEDNAPLRNYAQRVRELLEEYEYYADGRLKLRVIDPQPFSEEEDQATEYGLKAVPTADGRNLYFGLVGTNTVDDVEIIEFFQPGRETFLEYDISQLIYGLTNPAKPVVGILTGLQMFGSFDSANQAPIPEWAILGHLRQTFEVRQVDEKAKAIDPDIRILMLVHPKGLSDATLYAVDQFVMHGGRLMLFVDPYADKDPMFFQASNPPDSGGIQASDIQGMLDSWGLRVDVDQIVADRKQALPVQASAQARSVRHVSFLHVSGDGLNADNLVTTQLSRIILGFSGALLKAENFEGEFTPLLTTTTDSQLIHKQHYRYLPDPSALMRDFRPTEENYTLAAWIRAQPTSIFPSGPPEEAESPAEGHLASAPEFRDMIVVTDSDMLSDTLWTHVQDFFGQRVFRPWAHNGDFVANALESLAGSGDLIGLRGRSNFSRPFHVVDELRQDAEARLHEKEKALQAKLQETEAKIQTLQQHKQEGSDQDLLTEQQREEIDAFYKERSRVRRDLRAVRHELDQDIESLGSYLRLINIWLMPILVTVGALGLWWVQRRRRVKRAIA